MPGAGAFRYRAGARRRHRVRYHVRGRGIRLDQGALGNAISLLSDLSGGNKLVGIISHVEDLKANIPKRITVTKTRTGSTAKVEA